MDMTYTMKNNYLIPDLIIEKTTNQKTKLGKFAQMRLAYLKQNKRGTYTMLIGSNQLTAHLMMIQKVATERIEQMIEKMKEKYGITEEMKAKRPDGMGRTNEQYSSNSGTNSNKRNNLQLNDEDYTFLVGDIVYIGLKRIYNYRYK